MRLSRRQFVGLIGAAGLSGCARLGLDKVAETVKSVDMMPGAPGKLVRTNDLVVVRVTKTHVILPIGRIKLDRPIDGSLITKQRIKGFGRITLKD